MFQCICDENAYDTYNEFHSVRDVVARKSHTCCECGCEIKPGDTYEYAAGKSDGSLWTAKTCAECARIRDDVMTCGFTYGRLWASIHEANCGHPGDDDYFCICPDRKQDTSMSDRYPGEFDENGDLVDPEAYEPA